MWPFKVANHEIIVISLSTTTYAGARMRYNPGSQKYLIEDLKICSAQHNELEKMLLFNPTRLKNFILSLVPLHNSYQLRLCVTGPTLIENISKDVIPDYNIMVLEAPAEVGNYRCAMARECIFQYRLLAHMCNMCLTHLASGSWARINACIKSNSTIETPWIMDYEHLLNICPNIPENHDVCLLTELIGLCYLG